MPVPNSATEPWIWLGSRSPQRRQLLEQLIPADRILVAPPADEAELDFVDCRTLEEIESRAALIARSKRDAILPAWNAASATWLLTADTVIIADRDGESPVALGKPDGPDWKDRVREWFRDLYCGRPHRVLTAVCLQHRVRGCREFRVITEVHMRPYDPALVEWYLGTGEPLGKAGGYAVQGSGSLLIVEIRGSLSNVIGLPLEILREDLLADADAPIAPAR